MATITLNSRLSSHDPNGKFVYLGAIDWVNSSVNGSELDPNHPSQRNILPNASSDDCFGMWDADNPTASDIGDILNADLTPTILGYIGTNPLNPYGVDGNTVPIGSQGQVFSYSTSINFTGKNPGYYGFLYMVGDVNNDGVLVTECGDVECFEIEVVEEFADYDDLTLSYCAADAPSSLALYTLLNAENGSTLPNGGNWSAVSGIVGSVLNPGTGDISSITTPASGTYTYVYTLGVAQIGAYHDILPGTCTQSTTTVTIIISNNLSAGVGSSVTVCNS